MAHADSPARIAGRGTTTRRLNMAEQKKARAAAAPEKETAKAAAEVKVDKLVVRSLSAGFRRAGRAWPAEEVTVAASELTAEQIEQLLAEPMLVVLPVAAE